MNADTAIKLIEKEIEWCKEHTGESAESKDFERGFIKGLEQAIRLIKGAQQTLDAVKHDTAGVTI